MTFDLMIGSPSAATRLFYLVSSFLSLFLSSFSDIVLNNLCVLNFNKFLVFEIVGLLNTAKVECRPSRSASGQVVC